MPVLAITGDKDIQVDPDDVARMGELVAGTIHGGHPCRTSPTSSGPTLEHRLSEPMKRQAKRAISPIVLELISQWISRPHLAVDNRPDLAMDHRPRLDRPRPGDQHRDHSTTTTPSPSTTTTVVIKHYTWLRRPRRIPRTDIRHIDTFETGLLSGRYRLVGISPLRPRNWFSWERGRSDRSSVAVALDVGRFFHPTVTPDDPNAVVALLKASGTSPGDGPTAEASTP